MIADALRVVFELLYLSFVTHLGFISSGFSC